MLELGKGLGNIVLLFFFFKDRDNNDELVINLNLRILLIYFINLMDNKFKYIVK